MKKTIWHGKLSSNFLYSTPNVVLKIFKLRNYLFTIFFIIYFQMNDSRGGFLFIVIGKSKIININIFQNSFIVQTYIYLFS